MDCARLLILRLDIPLLTPPLLFFLLHQTDTVTQFRQSLLPTYTSVSSNSSQDVAAVYLSPAGCPYDTAPTNTAQGSLSVSSKHVPGKQDSTTWNRFFWVIQYAVGQVRLIHSLWFAFP